MATRVFIRGHREFQNQQIKLIEQLSEKQLQQCAEDTVTVIRFHIQTSIERVGSTGRLALGMFASKLTNGWGVGDIDYLNENVKYWAWQNYGVAGTGRRVPPGTNENPNIVGHFSDASAGRFLKGAPRFPMNPTKPIRPKFFIERTAQQIPTIVNSALRKFRSL